MYLITNETVLFGAGIVAVISLILAIVSIAMTASIRKKYKRIMVDGAGKDVTDAIIHYYEKCSKMMDEMRESEKRIETLEKNMTICGQKIGCYRYNAFSDNKANMSYAFAILDATNSGFVMNGVFLFQFVNTINDLIVFIDLLFKLFNAIIDQL